MMKEILNKIRVPDTNENLKNSIISTVLILLLGVFSKWLDNLSIDSTVWWQNILEILDLRNAFSLFGIWIFIAITISVFSKTPFKAAVNDRNNHELSLIYNLFFWV